MARLARDHDIEGLLQLLVDELTPADLTAVLVEVAQRRAAAASPASVLRQYERDRFVRPVPVDVRRLLDVQKRALDAVDPPFEPVVLSPLVPFATSAVLGGVSQNRTVSTMRNTEVLSDPTTALALEAALRRRDAIAVDEVVRLACAERVVRTPTFDGPRSYAHFSLLALVSAGRGSHRFDLMTVGEHITTLTAAANAVGLEHVLVALTDFGGAHRELVRELSEHPPAHCTVSTDSDRTAGRGYYPSICFKLHVQLDGELVEVGDGGLVDWTQPLVGSKKERLMTSALSLDRLASLEF